MGALLSILTALSLATVPPLPAHRPIAERELFPFDPVLLIGTGEKSEGDAAREVAYGNYRYRFAADSSKRAFEAMPSRFAIAFGGGCARMGPLSGSGDVRRFEVVDDKLYIFASDACRNSFMKAPSAFMEATDTPFPTDGRGVELSAAVRRWLRADAACPKEILVSGTRTERVGAAEQASEHRVRDEIRLSPNLTFTSLNAWDDDAWWTTAVFGPADARTPPVNAKRSTRQGEQPLDESQLEAFRREAMLEPLFLSRVLLQPDVKLSGGGVAEWSVDSKPNAAKLTGEVLRVHWRGVTVEWLLQPKTGQLLAQRAMKRARDMKFAQVTEVFAEWNSHAGVRIPMVRTEGTAVRRYDTVESGCDAAAVEVVPELDG